ADKTLRVCVVGENMVITNYSNATKIMDDGNVLYTTLQGLLECNGDNILIDKTSDYSRLYEQLRRDVHKGGETHIKPIILSDVATELRNAHGNLVLKKNGYLKIDNSTGFPLGDPSYVAIFKYTDEHRYLDIADSNLTYDYVANHDDAAYYSGERWIARVDDMRFEKRKDGKIQIRYKVNERERNSRRSIKAIAIHPDGRPFWEHHIPNFLKGNEIRTYYDEEIGVAERTIITTQFKGLSNGLERPYMDHIVVGIEDSPGKLWIWDETAKKGYWHEWEEFVDGEQAQQAKLPEKIGEQLDGVKRLIPGKNIFIRTEEPAGSLAQRDGKYFENGELIFEREDRYTPHSQRAYRRRGLGHFLEYFEILYGKHYVNGIGWNLLHDQERGVIKPLVTVVFIAIVAATSILPLALWAVTGGLSRLHFNKLGRRKRAPSAGPAPPPPDEDDSEKLRERRIKMRVSFINRHLNLTGPYTKYL
ncbi:hypothetical protein ACFL0T_08895, partial [Candidatus Omnitrophota bacterium]